MILEAGVETLEEAYKDKSVEEALGGVIAGVAFVQQLKQTIPVCKAVDSGSMNWTEFDKIVDTLESPEQHMQVIGEDVVMNGKVITDDISSALEAYKAGEYIKYGEHLGNAMYYATESNDTLFLH